MSESSDDYKMKLFNIAKAQLLKKLVTEGYLDKDDATQIDIQWQFVLYNPRWYEKWWGLTGGDDEKLDSQHVKLVDFETKEKALELLVDNDENS